MLLEAPFRPSPPIDDGCLKRGAADWGMCQYDRRRSFSPGPTRRSVQRRPSTCAAQRARASGGRGQDLVIGGDDRVELPVAWELWLWSLAQTPQHWLTGSEHRHAGSGQPPRPPAYLKHRRRRPVQLLTRWTRSGRGGGSNKAIDDPQRGPLRQSPGG